MTARAELPFKAVSALLVAAALVVGLVAGLDPALAVILAVAIGFTMLVMSDLAVGVTLFVGISFLDVLPFGGVAVSVAKVTGALLALSWLALVATRVTTGNDFFDSHAVLSYLLLAFLGWVTLSASWAEYSGAAFESVYRFALNLMLFPIVFTAIRSRRHIVWVLAAFLGGALVSAMYGVFATPTQAVGSGEFSRLSGAGLDPNELAALLVASLAFAAALAARRGAIALRLVAVAAVPFCLMGVLLSLSRGGLVALTVALLTAIIIGGRWRVPALVLLAIAALSVIVYFGSIATPAERNHITEANGGTGRTSTWKVGWRMVEANAVKGVGGDNFRTSSIHYLLEPGTVPRSDFIVEHPHVAHNMYLEVLADLGIVGLTLFLAIITFAIKAALEAARSFRRSGDARMELLARALVVAVAALLAADFFLSEQYSKQLWLLLALAPAMRAVARRGEAAPSEIAT